MLFIVAIAFFGGSLCQLRDEPCYLLKEVLLLPEGQLELNNHIYTIQLNSRVGIFGCFLCLVDTEEQAKPETLFIFKTSVSECDYSRLCRVIKRNVLEHSAS